MRDRTVFIHTNARQVVCALVAGHALRRNSRHPERFDVELIKAEDCRLLSKREGQTYLRNGTATEWKNDDLQSYVPLRFSVPQLMDYQGRAVVIGPDVFAIADVNELLDADMDGAAILARRMPADGLRPPHWSSSVMLLDCERLSHWDLERDLARLFAKAADYLDWAGLLCERPRGVGELQHSWNDLDHLGPQTRFLRYAHRRTQPWKTGLPADFPSRGTRLNVRMGRWARRIRARIDGSSPTGYCRRHPDRAQELLFFRLLAECLDLGIITAELLEHEIACRHIRADAARLARSALSRV